MYKDPLTGAAYSFTDQKSKVLYLKDALIRIYNMTGEARYKGKLKESEKNMLLDYANWIFNHTAKTSYTKEELTSFNIISGHLNTMRKKLM